MRKRVVITVLGLVIVAGTAVVLLRPWESRVAYHQRGLFEAGRVRWFDRWHDMWNSKRGNPPAWVQRTDRHEKALIDLGYYERRTFVLTNAPPAIAMKSIGTAAGKLIIGPWRIQQSSTTSLTIAGAREDMGVWEHIVREADVR
jgi:hypothetical protein